MATMFNQRWRNLTLAAAVTATLAACGGGGGGGGNNPPNNPPAMGTPGNTVAVTTMNRVVTFNRTTTTQQIPIATAVAITNLMTGDNVVGFDVRPQTGDLIVLTNNAGTGRVYTVNSTTGAASNPVMLVNNPANAPTATYTALTGANFGVDFNPVPDRLRIVSDTGQNLRVNVANGQVTVDGALNGASTKATEVAYNNNAANACRTTLFYIDPTTNMLFNTTNPNGGVLTAVGPLGVTSMGNNLGFEVITTADGMTNTAIAAINVAAGPQLYSIALGTGAATIVGSITGLMANEQIRGIGVTPPTAVTQTAGDMFGVNDNNQIFSFNAAAPNKLCTGPTAIAPLNANESVVGIDTRPANGMIYGVGLGAAGAGRVFVIDKATGAVSAAQNISTPLAGANFGVDFNPVPDRLRVTSDTGQNLRINVADGTAIVDGAVNPMANAVTSSAYTNSFGPTAPVATTLYTIDSAAGVLNIQNPPNNGTQVLVGSLGIAGGITGVSGFDINGQNNTAVAGLTLGTNTTSTLHTINLTTGVATPVTGNVGAGVGVGTPPLTGRVRGMTFANNPQATVVGVTSDNRAVTFAASAPGTFTNSVAIAGLQGGETVVGLDVRPATNQFYLVTSNGRTLILDPATGMTSASTPLMADATDTTAPFTTLMGTTFGTDFNPVPDRLRVVSNVGQNLRANVVNGATITDGTLNRPARVTAAAYTNNFGPSPAPAGSLTTLYVIDTEYDRLFVQNPPNAGTLTAIAGGGSLGVDATGVSGFEIVGPTTAFAVFTTPTTPATLYSIDLTTGAATSVGALGTLPTDRVGGFTSPISLTAPATNAAAFVLVNGTALGTFTLNAPGAIASLPITGLMAGESLLGIDFRPADGNLYGLSNQNRIYTISIATGAATLVSTLINSPTNVAPIMFTNLVGTNFAVDFNPVPDRLRVVSDTGQNLRINVATGEVIVDGSSNLAVADPQPGSIAAGYSSNFAGTTTTTLYVIDAAAGTLMIQNPPNDGTVSSVGKLDPTGMATFTGSVSFEVSGGADGIVYAALQPTGATQSSLYRVNLATGVATPIAGGTAAASAVGPAGTQPLVGLAVRLQ